MIMWRIQFVIILESIFDIASLQRPEEDTRACEKPFTVEDNLLRISLAEVSENLTLRSIIEGFSDTAPSNSLLRHSLSGFRRAAKVKVCMQKLPCRSGALYIELDDGLPIKRAFANRTIIEYPTVIVASEEIASKLPMFIADEVA